MTATLFIVLFVLMFLSVPIAISLAISTIVVFYVFYPGLPMIGMLAQAMITSADSFTVMAIPFFMLVGSLMDKSGIAGRIVRASEAIAGTAAGGLGAAAILASVFFSAISGSGPAVVAAVGGILIPSMIRRGYSPAYSGALVAASGTIGPVIPPSIPMIMYGVTAGVSITKMFTGGFIPGMMMGGGLLAVNFLISKRRGYVGVERGNDSFGWIAAQVWNAKWALFMPVLVLGGIYTGFCSPTEAAVIGIMYTLFVGVVLYRQLTFAKIAQALVESAVMSATVMILVGGALAFGRLLVMSHIPEIIAEQMLAVSDTPIVILLLINAFLIIGGMFIDTVSNVILFTPLFLPIIVQLGYDPVYFGVIMTVNLCIGFLTPPLGMNLFIAQNVSKTTLEKVIREVLPFLAVLLLVLFVLIAFPEIVMFLVRLV